MRAPIVCLALFLSLSLKRRDAQSSVHPRSLLLPFATTGVEQHAKVGHRAALGEVGSKQLDLADVGVAALRTGWPACVAIRQRRVCPFNLSCDEENGVDAEKKSGKKKKKKNVLE